MNSISRYHIISEFHIISVIFCESLPNILALYSQTETIEIIDHLQIRCSRKKSQFHRIRHSGEPRIKSGAGAGIQLFQAVLDPGFRRGDAPRDFLRDHQIS
jgi:hypothetical protein